MKPIVADRIRLEEKPDGAVLSCRLTADGLNLPDELWYRFPPEFASFVSVGGDAFLPVVMLAGMSHRRDMVIEGEVSAALLASTQRIMRMLHDWSERAGDGLKIVGVRAPAAVRQRRGTSSGAFFSVGVDSFYTLLKNHRRYPTGDARLISHLILVHGFDIRLEQAALFDLVHRHAGEAARAFHKELLPVRTNARHVLDGLGWEQYAHGAALAAVGLSLSGLFHTLSIAASQHFFDQGPSGTHPALDPLWSTEGLEFVHDGSEDKRADKVEFIATSPVALKSLRVCWENRGGAYNCGECEKCLRTMMDLWRCGVLEHAAAFPQTIDLDAVARQSLGSTGRHWRETLLRLKRTGGDPRAIASIERALRRGEWASSRVGRIITKWAGYPR